MTGDVSQLTFDYTATTFAGLSVKLMPDTEQAFRITAVPEPGSVGLAACGIAAVGFGAWRCRRQAGRRGG